jgi:hypothetical protein
MKGEEMATIMSRRYLSIHFDKNGKVIKVDPPKGKKAKKEKVTADGIFKMPINHINQVQPIVIVGNEKGSPCCIFIDGYKICWPPCI